MQIHHFGHHHWAKQRNKKKLSMLDTVVIIIAILGVLMTVPQISQIWISKHAANVSILTWSAYTIGSLFWFLYGAYHKEKIIMIPNFLGFIFNFIIVIGIVIYGA